MHGSWRDSKAGYLEMTRVDLEFTSSMLNGLKLLQMSR